MIYTVDSGRVGYSYRLDFNSIRNLVLDEGLKFGGFHFSFVVLNYLKPSETATVIKGYTNKLDSLPLK